MRPHLSAYRTLRLASPDSSSPTMAAVTVAPAQVAPLRVTITGAVGNIGYALVFMIAQGRALGPEQPVILQLLVSGCSCIAAMAHAPSPRPW